MLTCTHARRQQRNQRLNSLQKRKSARVNAKRYYGLVYRCSIEVDVSARWRGKSWILIMQTMWAVFAISLFIALRHCELRSSNGELPIHLGIDAHFWTKDNLSRNSYIHDNHSWCCNKACFLCEVESQLNWNLSKKNVVLMTQFYSVFTTCTNKQSNFS